LQQRLQARHRVDHLHAFGDALRRADDVGERRGRLSQRVVAQHIERVGRAGQALQQAPARQPRQLAAQFDRRQQRRPVEDGECGQHAARITARREQRDHHASLDDE
jgi:hypothetical protein